MSRSIKISIKYMVVCFSIYSGSSLADLAKNDAYIDFYNKNFKDSVTAMGLLDGASKTTSVENFLTDVAKKSESLGENLKDLSNKYEDYKYTIDLRSKGLEKPIVLESTKKAVQTLTGKIHRIGEDITKVTAKQNSILRDIKTFEGGKVLGDVGSKLGWAAVAAEVANDMNKLSNRVNSGSNIKAELLNSGLRVVENFIPSIPFVSTPSDVGRAMLDLGIALKDRNKSLLETASVHSNLTLDLIIGSNSIESQLARKLDGVPLEKLGGIYASVSKNQEDRLLRAADMLYQYRQFLTEERDDAWLKDSKAMFASLIAGIDLDIENILGEVKFVRDGKGFGVVMEYANWKAGQEAIRLSDESTQKLKQYSSEIALAASVSSAEVENSSRNSSVAWATVTMQNQLSAITNGGASHIGSASLYSDANNQQPNANVNPNNTNNYQTQTGAQQTASATNTQAFQSSDWVMVSGNSATHTGLGNSFGPLTAPDGGQIASLNNAGVQYTLMTKDFYVPVGVKQVTLTFNGNFVTNEYPQYVGSQYNDYASVKITSPSGNVTPVTAFNQALNSSNFTTVNGLPSPMMSSGGQTGFKASTATINVAGGGKVTVEVKVANVGDTAVPSAVLLNKITVK